MNYDYGNFNQHAHALSLELLPILSSTGLASNSPWLSVIANYLNITVSEVLTDVALDGVSWPIEDVFPTSVWSIFRSAGYFKILTTIGAVLMPGNVFDDPFVHFKHYTPLAGAAAIVASGAIESFQPDNLIYFTQDHYVNGDDAKYYLQLSNRPNGFFLYTNRIGEQGILGILGITGPTEVENLQNGAPTGGLEWVVPGPVPWTQRIPFILIP